MWRELKTLRVPNLGRVDLVGVAGVVKESSIGSETHVSSRGGGGVITPYGGSVQSPKVRSEVKYRTRVRLQDANSGQLCDVVVKAEAPFSPGDEIEIFACRTHEGVEPLRWINRTTSTVGKSADGFEALPIGNKLLVLLALPGTLVANLFSRTFAKAPFAHLVLSAAGAFFAFCVAAALFFAFGMAFSRQGQPSMFVGSIAALSYIGWALWRGFAFTRGWERLEDEVERLCPENRQVAGANH